MEKFKLFVVIHNGVGINDRIYGLKYDGSILQKEVKCKSGKAKQW